MNFLTLQKATHLIYIRKQIISARIKSFVNKFFWKILRLNSQLSCNIISPGTGARRPGSGLIFSLFLSLPSLPLFALINININIITRWRLRISEWQRINIWTNLRSSADTTAGRVGHGSDHDYRLVLVLVLVLGVAAVRLQVPELLVVLQLGTKGAGWIVVQCLGVGRGAHTGRHRRAALVHERLLPRRLRPGQVRQERYCSMAAPIPLRQDAVAILIPHNASLSHRISGHTV